MVAFTASVRGLINRFQQSSNLNNITPQELAAEQNAMASLLDSLANSSIASVMNYGAVGDGVADDTAAFNKALLANTIVIVPPLKFLVGNIIMNPGNTLLGFSSVSAAYPGSAGAIGSSTKAFPVLLGKAGTSRILNVDNAYPYRVEALLLDGQSNSVAGIEQPTFASKSAGTINNCVVVNCTNGLNANYSVIHANNTRFGNNTTGTVSPLDSMFTGCAWSGNTQHGLSFGSGAGSSSITGCRFEWNGFAGISVGDGSNLANGASRINITGGWCDRNGWAGVAIEPGTDVSITGMSFMRNGSLDNGLWAQAHIYLWGSARVALTGITTSIGTNDDGSGNLTPRYCVAFDVPAGSAISISGAPLTGYTVSAIGGTPPADVTTTGTAHVTSGSLVVSSLSTTASACIGQRVTGTGIPIGNTIASIDSVTQITMKGANATATNTTVAVTFKGDYVTGSTVT